MANPFKPYVEGLKIRTTLHVLQSFGLHCEASLDASITKFQEESVSRFDALLKEVESSIRCRLSSKWLSFVVDFVESCRKDAFLLGKQEVAWLQVEIEDCASRARSFFETLVVISWIDQRTVERLVRAEQIDQFLHILKEAQSWDKAW